MTEKSSHRQILRSSSIIGGASVVNILVGLLRTKVAAVLLGPAGVGIIGLLQSLMVTASAVSALGFGTVGTRQVAEAAGSNDEVAMAQARRALFWGTILLALVGASIFWLLRNVLAQKVFGDTAYSGSVGWLALGVALGVIAGSQIALLNGLRRVGDIARVSILSAVLSTAIGIVSVWQWGSRGILAFVLAAPAASFIFGLWFATRVPRIVAPDTPLRSLFGQWSVMARLGTSFMLAGLAVAVGHLLVRTMVQRELGPEALGHFQAAWMISMTYIGFVLSAMGTDYYPRLTATIKDHSATNRLVNEQTEVALLLAGPVFLGMLGFAPWVIEVLYSSQFGDAVAVLRWQILGDLIKVAGWPMGFIILAAGDGRAFMLVDIISISVFAILTWIGLPIVGIEATGMSFLAMYMVYLPVVFILGRRRTGFLWQRRVAVLFLVLFATAALVFVIGAWSSLAGALIGFLTATVLGIYGFVRLGEVADPNGLIGRLWSKLNSMWS